MSIWAYSGGCYSISFARNHLQVSRNWSNSTSGSFLVFYHKNIYFSHVSFSLCGVPGKRIWINNQKKGISASEASSPHFESAQDMAHNWFIPQAYSPSFSLLTGCSFLTEVLNMIFALWWCTFPCFHMLNSLLYPKTVSEERKWWRSVSSSTQKSIIPGFIASQVRKLVMILKALCTLWPLHSCQPRPHILFCWVYITRFSIRATLL